MHWKHRDNGKALVVGKCDAFIRVHHESFQLQTKRKCWLIVFRSVGIASSVDDVETDLNTGVKTSCQNYAVYSRVRVGRVLI